MSSQLRFSVEEICEICDIESEVVWHYVSCSWVEPMNQSENFFDEEDVARIKLIGDLQDKMGVNDDAIPIILHLIDQLNLLRQRSD